MEASDVFTILTAVGALIVSLVAIGRLRVDSKKIKVDMSTSLVGAAAELVDDLREEVKRMRERITHLEDEHKKETLRLSLDLEQSRERISVLEGENVRLLREIRRFYDIDHN